MATKKEAPAKTTEAPKGPFVHQLQLYLVGGQQFTVNEVTDTVDMPRNVIAFVEEHTGQHWDW